MRSKKTLPRKRAAGRTVGQAKTAALSVRGNAGRSSTVQDLTERIDIVLPEVTGRVAALEHLLLELKLCTMADLRRAREFVRIQEA